MTRRTVWINFAHRTFGWESEARGKAHVHVVIIGFSRREKERKKIFEYQNEKGEPTVIEGKRICPYLADAPTVFLENRRKPLCKAHFMNYGSMANDKKKKDKGFGNLILDAASRKAILDECPEFDEFIRPYMGSVEFLNNKKRWCLWLVAAPPQLIRSCVKVKDRVAAVKECREQSGRPETKRLATTPTLFGEIRQPNTQYLLVPKVSSQSRRYLPVGFIDAQVIANGSALIVPGATQYDFGVLSSKMHVAWLSYVGGRMKSDYQYSAGLVYNNYPWPESPTDKQKADVEAKAQAVLDARAAHPEACLADLYDPLTMPANLTKAHTELDRAVDVCYRSKPFASDRERVEFLFARYEKLTAPLTAGLKEPKRRGKV